MLGHAHAHPAVFALDPEAAVLQVMQEAAMRLVVGVGNVVPILRLLAGDLTYPSHGSAPEFGRGAILHYFCGLRIAPSEGGTGAGGTWSRGPTCGDATVELAIGASTPALRAPSGSDPQRGPSSALRRAPLGDVTPETDAAPALDGAAPDS